MSTRAWRGQLLVSLICGIVVAGCGGGGGAAGTSGIPVNDAPVDPAAHAVPEDPPSLAIDTASYQLVSTQRVGRTTIAFSYLVNVANTGGTASNARATVVSNSPDTVVTDGAVGFGDVAANAIATSLDTFTIQQDRTVPFNPASLAWTVAWDAPVASFALVADNTALAGFVDAGTVVPFRIQRHGGFDGTVTVGLHQPPAGLQAIEAVLPAGAGNEGEIVIEVAGTVQPGEFTLDMIASAGGETRTVPVTLTVQPAQPRAQALIRQALADGLIDRATALLYRGYARYGDPRLPPEFRGSGSEPEDTGLEKDIESFLPDASPETRVTLEPFIRRPTDPAGWYAQLARGATLQAAARSATLRVKPLAHSPTIFHASCDAGDSGWISMSSSSHPVRVWAECNPEDPTEGPGKINVVMPMVDKIWGPMTNDMGPALADTDCSEGFCSAQESAGDPKIDIYLIKPGSLLAREGDEPVRPRGAAAWAVPWKFNHERGTSGYVVIPDGAYLSAAFLSTFTHEVFHVLEMAHVDLGLLDSRAGGIGGAGDIAFRWWFFEASATWAEAHYDRVLPPTIGGRLAAKAAYIFFPLFQARGPETPLNIPGSPGGAGGGISNPAYRAFIWPYFMEQEADATAIFDTWKALPSNLANGSEGADQVLDSKFSFADHFREFAVRNFNQTLFPGDALPEDKRHVHLDPEQFQPYDGLAPLGLKQELLDGEKDYRFEFKLAPLAAQYVRFGMGDNTELRKVVLDLGEVHAAGLKVDAFLKLQDRDWERRQYDGEDKLTFCLDDPEQNLEDVYLIISDTRLKPYTAALTETGIPVQATRQPCTPKWSATVNSRMSHEDSGGRTDTTVNAQMILEFSDEFSGPDEWVYLVESGNFSYEARFQSEGRNPACSVTATANGRVFPWNPANPFEENTAQGGISIALDSITGRYAVLDGSLVTTVKNVSDCNDDNTNQTTYLPGQMIFWWKGGFGEDYELPPDGQSTTGTSTSADGSTTFDWTLRKTWVDE